MTAPIDPAIYLVGPTGSGKSAVAMALGTHLGNAVIVNADAYQIYRGYEILSAAPSEEDRSRLPHHLFGALDLSESCDAARYAALARPLIDDLARRGAQPIVVGGSGLYLKALTHGLADTPPASPTLRAELEALSLDELIDRYRKADPAGAATTNLKNRRYVTRNLEITHLAGRPASLLKSDFAISRPKIRGFVLTRERSDLYDRINHRTLAMFTAGVVEEIRTLENAELSLTAAKAIGLAEIRSLLAGDITEAEAIARIQQATRRYAKRQGTWFRRESAFLELPAGQDETAHRLAERILGQLSPISG